MSELIDLPGQGTRYAVRLVTHEGFPFLAYSGDEGVGINLFRKHRDAVKYRDELVMHGLPRGKVVRVHVSWRITEEAGPKRRRKS
jgi:hypothetical protein